MWLFHRPSPLCPTSHRLTWQPFSPWKMEKYIKDSLIAGLIRPSSSPLRAGFFFVWKKGKTLRPCIEYCGFNDTTKRTIIHFPLLIPLLNPCAMPSFLGSCNARNAYHLVWIWEGDKWMIAFNTTLGHLNSWWCCLHLLMLLLSSRLWLMTFFGISSISLCLCICTKFKFTTAPWRNILTKYNWFPSGFWRINLMSNQQNVSCPGLWVGAGSTPTLLRHKWWRSDHAYFQ